MAKSMKPPAAALRYREQLSQTEAWLLTLRVNNFPTGFHPRLKLNFPDFPRHLRTSVSPLLKARAYAAFPLKTFSTFFCCSWLKVVLRMVPP